jgi:hypothetical protein
MSDEPKKRSRRWIGWTVLALLVLYPLSMGPADALCGWILEDLRPLDPVYHPLFLIADACGLSGWYVTVGTAYVHFWEGLRDTLLRHLGRRQ